MSCTPNKVDIWDQRLDVNWEPLSDVINNGTPNRDTQLYIRAAHNVGVAVSVSGTASGQRENLSTMVSR